MKGSAPSARSSLTLGEDVAHRPARGRRSHQPNLGLRPRPLPGGHCSLSTGPPLLAHREVAEILIPQGTKLTLVSAACWNCRIPSVPLDPLTQRVLYVCATLPTTSTTDNVHNTVCKAL